MIDPIISQWIEREKRREGRKGRRATSHFDAPVSISSVAKLIATPSSISTYEFFPFIYYPKTVRRYRRRPNGLAHIKTKIRPIMYASNRDSYVYAFYAEMLNDAYERELQGGLAWENVIAYRTTLHKNNIHFASEVFDFVRSKAECVVLTFDVTGFFDHIEHSRLKQAWSRLINETQLPEDHYKIFRSLTHYSFVERAELVKHYAQNGILPSPICKIDEYRQRIRPLIKTNGASAGIPQGSPLSGLLANVYMYEFDCVLSERLQQVSGLYRRYSDDIAIVCSDSQADALEALITSELLKLGLQIQKDKTTSTRFTCREGSISVNGSTKLQYLGFEFDGKGIYVRSSTIARKLRKTIRRAKLGRKKSENQKQKKRFSTPKKYGKNYYLLRSMSTLNNSQLSSQISRINRTNANLDRKYGSVPIK